MTSSQTPPQSSWHPTLDDFAGITENFTVGGDSADMLRELLITSGMTLKNPAAIIAANARLVWGSAGAFRAAVGRAIGRDNAGPIANPPATDGSPMPLIKRIRRILCWLSSICCSASMLPSFWTPPV